MTGPKWPLVVVVPLVIILLVTVVYAAAKPTHPATSLHPCAAVLERGNEQVCR